MKNVEIVVSINQNLLDKVDSYIKKHMFKNRSHAVQLCLQDKVKWLERQDFITECKKINPKFEQALADEGVEDFI